jgi:hypothetical protein
MLTFTTSRSSQARRSSAFSRSKAAANDLRTLWAGIVSVQAIVRPIVAVCGEDCYNPAMRLLAGTLCIATALSAAEATSDHVRDAATRAIALLQSSQKD